MATEYKVSQYNVPYKRDNTYFLYNSHTGAFVKLNATYRNYLKDLNSGKEIPNTALEEFTRAGFVVPKDRDELGLYLYQHNLYNYGNTNLHLTVATTLQCNFRCPYCYEEHVDEYLEGEKEEDLKKFIQQNTNNKESLSVTWYGGEPLLMKKLIANVSEYAIDLCEKKGMEYSATMVTNGYLLDRKTALELVEKYKLSHVQITLDGGPETHNLTRILRNGKGTFDKILSNIKEIYDLVDIAIRVNVSKENVEDVYKLFPILLKEGLNKKLTVYFAPVGASTEACQSISETCLVTREFSKWETSLIEYADSIGFEMGDLLPVNRGGGICQAVDNSAYVVDAAGDLFKCWHEVGNKKLRVGTLKDGITNYDRLTKWMNWQLPKKCTTCNIMPLCKGRCPDLSLEKEDFECDQLKYNIKDRLHRYYTRNPISKQTIEKDLIAEEV